MEDIFGRKAAYVIDFCVAFSYLGYLTVFVSIFSDYINQFITLVSKKDSGIDVRIIKLVSIPILAGLSMFKSSDAIARASAFAIICIVITVVAIIVYFIIYASKGEYDMLAVSDDKKGEKIHQIFPGPAKTLWPMRSDSYKGVLDVFKYLPLFMPLFGA